MKALLLLAATMFCCLSIASGQAKILTNDPLTGLPLLPATDFVKKVGNEPVKMPGGSVCQSKMQGDFYKLYDYFSKDNITLNDAVAWYGSHLSGFKKVASSNNAQTVFYKSDGTMLVIVTSQSSAKGAVNASSVAYERYQPGISEKTITSLTQEHILCK